MTTPSCGLNTISPDDDPREEAAIANERDQGQGQEEKTEALSCA